MLTALALVLLLPAEPVLAEDSEDEETAAEATGSDGEMEEIEETIVVTASRFEQPLHEVPAAVTVLSAEDMERIPADDFGDFLRNVPGLNVSQMSARDIQITGRAATFSLATSELVLLDNRTLYLDFFGFVMWDYVPMDPKEIKQIEVVRGPGSAVWGANAMTGVINLITKKPREMEGTSLAVGGGELGTAHASLTHAGVKDKLSYKLSGSYYEQDPYDRPTGTIPGTEGPANPFGTPYPPFENRGTEQPKVNLRFDYDTSEDTFWVFSGGYAATDGIIHSGIGPFDISSGSLMNFVKVDWAKRAARLTFFVNILDGDADNLLARGVDGQPLAFAFESETYNLDFADTRIFREKNILTYGATARRNNFDLSIAPRGDNREEYGVFLQDEILFGEKVRWLIGARWDDIDPIGSVFSPRTSLLLSPNPEHTIRLSYNRAFRAPSMINNFLQITIVNQAVIPPIPPLGILEPISLIFPSLAAGNPFLQEEQLDAIEVGYVGTFGPTTFTASVYRNEKTDETDFFTAAYYDSQNPVPGWPLPPFFLDPPFPFAETFPAVFSYRNIGETVDQGLELALNFRPSRRWSAFINYSYQDEPEVKGIAQVTLPNGTVRDAVNTPPEHRFNAGFGYDQPRYFFHGNVNWVDEAFWTDVLDESFWGPTDSYTQVNLGAGVRFRGEKVTLSVNAQNVFDEDVIQHVFGDIISRKVSGQLLFRF
jgi:outer membrane receptor protein involved in Fe transport